ncbi:MAG: PDZ domain-containing protein [Gemmatimonadetes bacterium]|nr:PDZ domain-containing protein [Gemmatimonadota bacterium]
MSPRLVFPAVAAIALAGLGLPARGWAQADSMRMTVIRASTPFEQQVERLARMLVGQQQRVMVLTGTRQQLQQSLRSTTVPEVQRGQVLARLRLVENELSSLDVSRVSLRRQLEDLCARTQTSEGWLGIAFNGDYTMDATPDGVLMAVRRPPEVETVEPGSPAEKAGLRRGDLLLSLGGRELSDAVIALNELLRPGTRVPVRFKRGTDTRTVTVLIEPRPADFRPSCGWEDDVIARALAPTGNTVTFVVSTPEGRASSASQNPFTISSGSEEPAPVATTRPSQGPSGFTFIAGSSARLLAGTQLVPVNEGIATLTGVERGVFVAEVARRSLGAQAGLVAGDVIVSVDGRPIASPVTLVQLMERSAARELKLQVVRQKRSETLTLKW